MFLRDDTAMSVWEMLRRFQRPTACVELSERCGLPSERVQAAVDLAIEIGIVERVAASRRAPKTRYRVRGSKILISADHTDPALREVLSEGFARTIAQSRRLVDGSMSSSIQGWKGMQVLHQMDNLQLSETEARELMALLEAVRTFIDRMYERDPERDVVRETQAPHACNYHLALHLAPIETSALPSPRIEFVEQNAVPLVERDHDRRSTSVLSPRERSVARLLVHGRTMAEVAVELGVSNSTISTLAQRIYKKLGITRRAQLALRMHALGE